MLMVALLLEVLRSVQCSVIMTIAIASSAASYF